jgi:site-specific recombinase XerD
MIANDIDIETVRSVLGHADISTTYHYVHPYEKNIRNATNKLEKIITTKESEENN